VERYRDDTHLSGSFGIRNKETPGVLFALLPHHRAMQYVPPAFGALAVFLLKFLLLLLFIHVLVTNDAESFDTAGMGIFAFNTHSTLWPSDAVLIILSGTTSSSLMVHKVCFHFGCAESEMTLPQDIPAILKFCTSLKMN
jgi:hypothetical protein